MSYFFLPKKYNLIGDKVKIIIDPYRGGKDTGKLISNQYEKNILLDISNYMSKQFKNKGIDTELVRNNDVSLTDDERNQIDTLLKANNISYDSMEYNTKEKVLIVYKHSSSWVRR